MVQQYIARVILFLVLLLNPWAAEHQGDIFITNTTIPDEAIRLRILANSDSPHDQWLKHRVRDEVFHYVQAAGEQINTINASREWIEAELPNITRLVEQTVKENGFSYDVTVDYGSVPFPTKIYGNDVYPAGEYEAVRITIGNGNGANWWCVLFPPLCFVDMSNAAAVTDEADETDGDDSNEEDTEETENATDEEKTEAESEDETDEDIADESNEQMLEVRFFIVDWFNRLLDKIKHV